MKMQIEERERREEEGKETGSEGGKSSMSDRSSRGREGFSSRSSMISILSDRDMDKLKSIVIEKEKQERKNNIVIKGITVEGKVWREWVQQFIKEGVRIKLQTVKVGI